MPDPADESSAASSDASSDALSDAFLVQTEAYIAAWHGIAAPNDPARRLAADLAATIRAFEAQRHRLRFEDEPGSFEAALVETRDMG